MKKRKISKKPVSNSKSKTKAKKTAEKKRPVHVLVTGGGKGIGAAISSAFATLGARVTIVGRDKKALEKQVKLVSSKSKAAKMFAIKADVTSESDIASAFKAARKKFGPIQILVNNAGGAESAPLGRTSRALWQETMDVNATSAFLCSREVLGEMFQGSFGRIINISSTAGLQGFGYVAAYCAAKHALLGLTRALAIELSSTAITVNAVCPGFTETEMLERSIEKASALTGRARGEIRLEFRKMNPEGRLVKPKEVAEAVLWLCLPDQDLLTGRAVVLPGGEVLE